MGVSAPILQQLTTMSDDDWETDADFENNLTETEQRAFGNKATMDKYNAVMDKKGGHAPGESTLAGTPIRGLASGARDAAPTDVTEPKATSPPARGLASAAGQVSSDDVTLTCHLTKPEPRPSLSVPPYSIPPPPASPASAPEARPMPKQVAPPPPPSAVSKPPMVAQPAPASAGIPSPRTGKLQMPAAFSASSASLTSPAPAPPPAPPPASGMPHQKGGPPPAPHHGAVPAHAPHHGAITHLTRRPSDMGAKELREVFDFFDANGDGAIELHELSAAMAKLRLPVSEGHLAEQALGEADANADRKISFAEFTEVVERIKAADGGGGLAGGARAFEQLTRQASGHVMQSRLGNTVHSFAEDECAALIDFMNAKLRDDPSVSYLIPMRAITELFTACSDGTLLCKLVNLAHAETIDERVINYRPPNTFLVLENLNLALGAAKSIGCKLVNIGPTDVMEGRPHLVLGLVWQLVKAALLSSVSLVANPFLIRLLGANEDLEMLLKLKPETLLLRWFNHHLASAGVVTRLESFGAALADSSLYLSLLSVIDPEKRASASVLASTPDPHERAKIVLGHAARLGAEFSLRPADIVAGNERLNLAFVAAIFNACPGLAPPEEHHQTLLAELPNDDEDDAGDSREERAFRMWINSLGLPDAATADGTGTCHHLFDDVRDGALLLHMMDILKPGTVEWARVNRPPVKLVFKRIENLNYAIDLALGAFRLSLVGVQGKDLSDGNRKLTLALIWQLMRSHLVSFLASLRSARGGNHAASDAEIVSWANDAVAASGRPTRIRDLADRSLADSLFLIDLLAAVEPRCIDRSHVTDGASLEHKALNAKYAISSARKLGCSIFVVWEDLVDVRPKMVLSFVATLMAFQHAQQATTLS